MAVKSLVCSLYCSFGHFAYSDIDISITTILGKGDVIKKDDEAETLQVGLHDKDVDTG